MGTIWQIWEICASPDRSEFGIHDKNNPQREILMMDSRGHAMAILLEFSADQSTAKRIFEAIRDSELDKPE